MLCDNGLNPSIGEEQLKSTEQLSESIEGSSYLQQLKELALQLQTTCDKKGVETDCGKSAEIIHKLGLMHLKRSPEKIALIKGVGLLNSAIARKPSNVAEIEKDLSEICHHILKKANAQDVKSNLIEQAKLVKSQIESMRGKTNRSLALIKNIQMFEERSNSDLRDQQLQKIKSIKRIQLQITSQYKEIMQSLCRYCLDVFGPAPCKFAVVGMGSVSRKEITPYSDFEHIILLEVHENYENSLEYFRWFSVVFHVIILNLQETIIPSLHVMYLNDKTCDMGDWFFDHHTSGVSFDGMMPHACKFPLGRTQHTKRKPWTTELIKPVDQMLEYLSSDVALKNGYHLSDILTETCFVYGDHILHDDFQKGIQFYKKCKSLKTIHDEIKKQVKEDLDAFATRIRLANLKPNDKLNVKQMFYRISTLFIAALGKLSCVKSTSCFDIVHELAKQRKISRNTKHKLSLAVAIACEIRLEIYMKEKSQRDFIQPCQDATTIFEKILLIIDIDSLISYFQITYCLQRKVIKLLGFEGAHIYSNESLLNITICHALRLDLLMLSLFHNFNKTVNAISATDNVQERKENEPGTGLNDFDKHLQRLENDL